IYLLFATLYLDGLPLIQSETYIHFYLSKYLCPPLLLHPSLYECAYFGKVLIQSESCFRATHMFVHFLITRLLSYLYNDKLRPILKILQDEQGFEYKVSIQFRIDERNHLVLLTHLQSTFHAYNQNMSLPSPHMYLPCTTLLN